MESNVRTKWYSRLQVISPVLALRWALENFIWRYKLRWVVRRVLEHPGLYIDPRVAYAQVAPDIVFSGVDFPCNEAWAEVQAVGFENYIPQFSAQTSSMGAFSIGMPTQLGDQYVRWVISIHSLKQAAADLYALQHEKLISLDPDLKLFVSHPCFFHRSKDRESFILLLCVNDILVT